MTLAEQRQDQLVRAFAGAARRRRGDGPSTLFAREEAWRRDHKQRSSPTFRPGREGRKILRGQVKRVPIRKRGGG